MAIIKVKTGGITADAVTDALIADDVVGTEHLTANEVDTTALGADAVTGAQLADNAVNSEHYTDGSVDTAHIADAQITTAKLSTAVFTGATDIGAAIVDADLFLMDDGAGGTIRKTTASRIKTYIGGGVNTPYVRAYASGNQNMSNATTTKVLFGGETFDTNNDFASSRFTPTVAGKYFITSQVNSTYSGNAPVNEYLYLRKNGTTIMSGSMRGSGHGYGFNFVQDIVEFNGSSDYVEVFAYGDNTTAYIIEGGSGGYNSNFTAFKLIE